MATLILTDAKILVGGFDVSANSNEVTVEYGAEMLDATAFGDTTRKRVGGLSTARLTGRGWWDSPVPDKNFFEAIGVDDDVVSVFPTAIIEGSTSTGSGFAFKSVVARYNPAGRVGDLFAFDLEAEGRGIEA